MDLPNPPLIQFVIDLYGVNRLAMKGVLQVLEDGGVLGIFPEGKFLCLANLAGAGEGAVGGYIGGPIADCFSCTLIVALYGLVILLSLLSLPGIRQDAA